MSLPIISDTDSNWLIVTPNVVVLLPNTLQFTSGDLYPDYSSSTFRASYGIEQSYKGDKQYIAKHLDLVNGIVTSSDQFALLKLIDLESALDIATKLIYTLPNLNTLEWDLEPKHSHIVNDRAINYGYKFDLKMAVTNLEPELVVYTPPISNQVTYEYVALTDPVIPNALLQFTLPTTIKTGGVFLVFCEGYFYNETEASYPINQGWQSKRQFVHNNKVTNTYYHPDIQQAINNGPLRFYCANGNSKEFVLIHVSNLIESDIIFYSQNLNNNGNKEMGASPISLQNITGVIMASFGYELAFESLSVVAKAPFSSTTQNAYSGAFVGALYKESQNEALYTPRFIIENSLSLPNPTHLSVALSLIPKPAVINYNFQLVNKFSYFESASDIVVDGRLRLKVNGTEVGDITQAFPGIIGFSAQSGDLVEIELEATNSTFISHPDLYIQRGGLYNFAFIAELTVTSPILNEFYTTYFATMP